MLGRDDQENREKQERETRERKLKNVTHKWGWRPIVLRAPSIGSPDGGVAGGWGKRGVDGYEPDLFAKWAEERHWVF